MPLIWVKFVKESFPRNWDRLFAKAGQWHRKCSNDSSSSMHALQTLWFTEPILCRCARKPVCAVRMPMTLPISLFVSFSNVLVLSSLGSPHRSFVVTPTFPLFYSVVWACLDHVINSDRVAPKGFAFSRFISCNSLAFVVRSFGLSLPLTPWWPGTHMMRILSCSESQFYNLKQSLILVF